MSEELNIYSKLSKDRMLFLYDAINTKIATKFVANLFSLNLASQTDEIKLYINSPGGELDALHTIYDAMQYIQAPISTICMGEASSAAAIILLSGSKGLRFAFPNSTIMLHNVQVSQLSGSHSELQKETKRISQDGNILMEIIARHTGQSLKKIKRDCKEDKFFTAQEAVAYGIIDALVPLAKNKPELKR